MHQSDHGGGDLVGCTEYSDAAVKSPSKDALEVPSSGQAGDRA